MPWLRLDDAMGEHRKTRRLIRKGGLAPFGLHALAMLHASRYLTDGFVEDEYVTEALDAAGVRGRKRTEIVAVLEETGQWSRVTDGWELHDYLDYNPTRARVEDQRRRDAARKSGTRNGHSERSPSGVRAESERTPDGFRGESDRPVPSRPVPDQEELNGSSSEATKATPDQVRLCHLLADLVVERDPKAKPNPDSAGWLRPMRLLLEDRDGDAAEVERVLRWSQADPFWQTNILSPLKLRKQFTALTIKMKAAPIREAADQRAAPTRWQERSRQWAIEDGDPIPGEERVA